MNVVLFNKAALPSSITTSSSTSTNSVGIIDSLPPGEENKIRNRARVRDGAVWAFIGLLLFEWACVLAARLPGNVRMPSEYRENEEGERDFSGNMVESVYSSGLFMG